MSWAAHQFEYYALQGHLPRRWLGKISFLGIVVGDQSCDLIGKLWAYGFDVGGTHYGPEEPVAVASGVAGPRAVALVAVGRHRRRCGVPADPQPGVDAGRRARRRGPRDDRHRRHRRNHARLPVQHADLLDRCVGVRRHCRRRQVPRRGGVLQQLGLRHGRPVAGDRAGRLAVPADAVLEGRTSSPPTRRRGRWLGRRMPERALVTLYRAWFIYAVCRLIAWTSWAHVIEDFEWDFTLGRPGLDPQRPAVPSRPVGCGDRRRLLPGPGRRSPWTPCCGYPTRRGRGAGGSRLPGALVASLADPVRDHAGQPGPRPAASATRGPGTTCRCAGRAAPLDRSSSGRAAVLVHRDGAVLPSRRRRPAAAPPGVACWCRAAAPPPWPGRHRRSTARRGASATSSSTRSMTAWRRTTASTAGAALASFTSMATPRPSGSWSSTSASNGSASPLARSRTSRNRRVDIVHTGPR